MPKKLSDMNKEELGKLFPVVLEKHNKQWLQWYEKEKQQILKHVAGIVDIHHYGSTAIPNILAKPTIDILAEVNREEQLDRIKTEFESIGYIYI